MKTFATFIAMGIQAFFLWYLYRTMAITFNIPEFNYWVALSAVVVINLLKPSVTINNEKEKEKEE